MNSNIISNSNISSNVSTTINNNNSNNNNSNNNNSNNNKSSSNDQNSAIPPLPPGSHTIQVKDCKSDIQENKAIMDTLTPKELPSIALIQNPQPSHDDWPPSLL